MPVLCKIRRQFSGTPVENLYTPGRPVTNSMTGFSSDCGVGHDHRQRAGPWAFM